MKLVRKFTLILVLGMSIVLAFYGRANIQREVDLFQEERANDVMQVGRSLSVAVQSVWTSEGARRALDLIEKANEEEKPLRLRWVWFDAPLGDPDAPDLVLPLQKSPDALANLHGFDRTHEERLYTYIPVAVPDHRRGGLEISRTTSRVHAHAASTLVDMLLMTALAGSTSLVLALILGIVFVGRPVHALVLQARRIGAGDLGTRLHLRSRDELGELANEMNLMCDRLAEARENLARETASRIATLEQLRHADRLATVGRLAAGIAHELGTPLNVISGRARMIATKETEGEEALEAANIVIAQTERMTAIIRQLLDFARRSPPRRVPEDLGAIARRSLELLRPFAKKRGVETRFEGGEQPLRASVDAGQVEQALTNLIMNGLQAMTSGGTLTVGVRAGRVRLPADLGGREDELGCIWVRDGGSGIRPEDLSRIFEPFFTTKDVGEGTGLGLPVSYGIVREHGGWIAVESTPGQGSCFSIYLPQGTNECVTAS